MNSVWTSRRARTAAIAAFALLVALLVVASPAGALMLSPAFALLLLVAADLFPSEQLIRQVRRLLRKPRRRTVGIAPPPVARGVRRRTGLAIAFALAVRPPPRGPLALI